MTARRAELLALRNLALICETQLLRGTDADWSTVREAVISWHDTVNGVVLSEGQNSVGGKGGGVSNGVVAQTNFLVGGKILEESKPARVTFFSSHHRSSWLGPFGAAWKTRYGPNAAVPWGRIGKALRDLVAAEGIDEVLRRFTNYLTGTSAQYVNPQRFAQTFGEWTRPNPDAWKYDVTEFRPGESQDAYIARQVRGGR